MTFTTDTMQGVALVPRVPRYVKKYVEFFADLTLQGMVVDMGVLQDVGSQTTAHSLFFSPTEYEFQQYPASLLAAAIVAAARRALSIRPLWCQSLTTLVGYSQLDIADVFSHVWKYYLECFPAEGAAADKAHASHATPTNVTAFAGELDEE